MPIVLETLNLGHAERELCNAALNTGGSIVEAATLLGITRHALKRRIVKYQIQWPPARQTHVTVQSHERMPSAVAAATG